MRRRVRQLLAYAVVAGVCTACSSSMVMTVPEIGKQAPNGLSRTVRVGEMGGAPCFRQQVTRYLSVPAGLQLAADGAPSDLIVNGNASRIEVHSNRGDKEAALAYFTAFVITAPIAAAMYGAKDWHADAAADGELIAIDAAGAVVWRKSLTVSIAETQRTMPSADALRTAMTDAVCQKLAATLLNALAEHLASAR